MIRNFNFIFITILLLSITAKHSAGQNVVNNGDQIVVNPGAYIVIGGNYINKNDGLSDGIVDLDGTIILKRNWVNEANNTVISGVGTTPFGNVVMDGTINQYIEGTNPTHFENLVLKNSDKILHVTDCEVNGMMTLDAVLKLNSNKIIMDNPDPDAIFYVSKYILSETSPHDGYGEVQWNIGSELNTYSVPFGSGLSGAADLLLILTTRSPGLPASDGISFATYPTDCHNYVLPEGTTDLDRDAEFVADRYYIVDPLYNLTKPEVDITFSYTAPDVAENCNANLNEKKLMGMRFNTTKNMWNDVAPWGTSNSTNNTVTVPDVAPDDFFAPWALVNEPFEWEIWFPSAFTPNADGFNDFFSPIGYNLEYMYYDMYIYNRWGELIFHTNEITVPWDGSTDVSGKRCQDGVYTYLVMVTDKFGKSNKYKGIVSLLH